MLRHMPASRDEIEANLREIREAIREAAERAGRDPASVELVAAAKTVPPEPIRWVVEAGVRSIGHNYVRSSGPRERSLPELDVRWHYIGALQGGTAQQVADAADVVQTVGGERAARRLAGRAARSARVLDVLIEVDFTGTRSGVPPERVPATADLLTALGGVRLRGLMTIPPVTPTAEEARPWFVRLRGLRDRIRRTFPDVLELSMGMSLDYQVAIEEGATMVRIGTALFGSRAGSGTRERPAP
jgi:pyridoxal phosphate enzyme (YggS family)